MSAVDEDVLLARAYLNRVAEPACIPLWGYVRDVGPVRAAAEIRSGTAPADVLGPTEARAHLMYPAADLEVADRRGIRLLVPESPDWPHFALACLESAGLERLREYRLGKRAHAEYGEPIPPLALWVRGEADIAGLAVRSLGVVGARACTGYGERVAAEFAFALGNRGFAVVSGGAFGIDAAAHRAALRTVGGSVLVSAGGLDQPYPAGNAPLFERCAESGLLVSESPPGAAPRRRRFLTRNRLVAAFSTGTVVVEASGRSGATNTAGHCLRLGRPLMVVPGPVTSAMSVGCHDLLRRHEGVARLVTSPAEVVDVVGVSGDLDLDCKRDLDRDLDRDRDGAPAAGGDGRAGAREAAARRRRAVVDALDDLSRAVFDSLPSRADSSVDEVVVAAALAVPDVLRSLAVLEGVGLIERVGPAVRLRRGGGT